MRVYTIVFEVEHSNSTFRRCTLAQCKNRHTNGIPEGWTEGSAKFTPADTTFSEDNCGAKDIPKGVKTQFDVFKLLIDEHIIEHLLKTSNQYAVDNKVYFFFFFFFF
jgi:hypothetical protein